MIDKTIFQLFLDKANYDSINTQNVKIRGNYVFVRINDIRRYEDLSKKDIKKKAEEFMRKCIACIGYYISIDKIKVIEQYNTVYDEKGQSSKQCRVCSLTDILKGDTIKITYKRGVEKVFYYEAETDGDEYGVYVKRESTCFYR